MITATCRNTDCKYNDTPRNVGGEPTQVVCGHCRTNCELTDLRPDPPEPIEE